MSDVSNLVKKRIKNKYITTADNNKFTKNIFSIKIKSEGLFNKCDTVGLKIILIYNTDLYIKK